MKNILLRFVAILLVPCLTLDPALACGSHPVRGLQVSFTQEAMTARGLFQTLFYESWNHRPGVVKGLLIPLLVVGSLAQEHPTTDRMPPHAGVQQSISTAQDFRTAFDAFQASKAHEQMKPTRRAINKILDRLLAQQDETLSADADRDLPAKGARTMLFVRLYTVFSLGGPLSLPDDLRIQFIRLKQLEEQTLNEIRQAETLLFPPVLDAKNPPRVSPHEFIAAYELFQILRQERLVRIANEAPHVGINQGLVKKWGTLKRSVSLIVTHDANDKENPYHIGQWVTDAKAWNILKLERVIQHHFEHLVVNKKGVFHRAHPALEQTLKSQIHLDSGVFEPRLQNEAPRDPDFPAAISLEGLAAVSSPHHAVTASRSLASAS